MTAQEVDLLEALRESLRATDRRQRIERDRPEVERRLIRRLNNLRHAVHDLSVQIDGAPTDVREVLAKLDGIAEIAREAAAEYTAVAEGHGVDKF